MDKSARHGRGTPDRRDLREPRMPAIQEPDRAAKILHEARNPRYPGLSPCEMALDFAALVAQKGEVVHDYRKKKYESLVAARSMSRKGTCSSRTPTRWRWMAATPWREGADRHRLAARSSANRRARPGAYLTSDLLTVDEPMEYGSCPGRLLIVGVATSHWSWGKCSAALGLPSPFSSAMLSCWLGL